MNNYVFYFFHLLLSDFRLKVLVYLFISILSYYFLSLNDTLCMGNDDITWLESSTNLQSNSNTNQSELLALLANQINEMQENLSTLEFRTDILAIENNSLSNVSGQHQAALNENNTLNQRIYQHELQNTRLLETIDALNNQISTLTEENRILTNQINNQQNETHLLWQEISQLRVRQTDIVSQNTEIVIQNTRLRRNVYELSQENVFLRQRSRSL